jgi:hypothetical protein
MLMVEVEEEMYSGPREPRENSRVPWVRSSDARKMLCCNCLFLLRKKFGRMGT